MQRESVRRRAGDVCVVKVDIWAIVRRACDRACARLRESFSVTTRRALVVSRSASTDIRSICSRTLARPWFCGWVETEPRVSWIWSCASALAFRETISSFSRRTDSGVRSAAFMSGERFS